MAKRCKRKAGLQKKVSTVFKGVFIPRRDGDEQTSPAPAPDGALGAMPGPAPAESLIAQSSVMKKVCRSRGSSDKTAPQRSGKPSRKPKVPQRQPARSKRADRPARASRPVQEPPPPDNLWDKIEPGPSVGTAPEPTAPVHRASRRPLTKKLHRAAAKPEAAAPDRIGEISPKLATPDQPDSQSQSVQEPPRAEDSWDTVKPDRTIGASAKLRVPGHPASVGFQASPLRRAGNVPRRTAPSRASWVPPKLTAPEPPLSQGSAPQQSPEAQSAPDEAEPGRTDAMEPLKPEIPENPPSHTSLAGKLRHTESKAETAAADRTAQAPVAPTSPDVGTLQDTASEKRHEPAASPKEAAPPEQSEAVASRRAARAGLWQRISSKLFAPKPGVSPARQKVVVISMPILAIILIFAFRQVLTKSPRKAKGAAAEDVPAAVAGDSGHEIDWQIPEPLPATMRDPTRLPHQVNAQSEDEQKKPVKVANSELINVGTLVYSHDKPSAVINGRIAHIGDIVNGVVILKINRDSVECEKDGERWVQKRRN